MPTIYQNTRIFTGDGVLDGGFVTDGPCFAGVGSVEALRRLYPSAPEVDLGGRFVCPGFNDSHMHLLELGCVLTQAQLAPCTDALAHVLAAVGTFAKAHPDEAFILGRGWNHDDFIDEHRYPTRDDLDTVCPDRPCLITRSCGHVAVANSVALRLAGIDTHPVPVDGGRMDVDDAGRPTGVLCENAIGLVNALVPKPDRAGIRERIGKAIEFVRSYGITSVQTDDLSSLDVPFSDILGAYQDLRSEGRLTVRVYEQCYLPTLEALDAFIAAGYHTGWGDEWLRLGPLKLIADGSLGSRTAFLRAPYTDAPDTCGIATYTQEALDAIVLRAHSAGMQIAIHAIGDGATDRALHAIGRAQQLCPREDARHGIVHSQVLDHAQAARMRQLGMHAYVQSIFLDYDSQIVESRLGARAQEAYPAASLLRGGVTLSNGSDCPVELPDVMAGIQCAVTRMSFSRPAEVPYLPHEALSLTDAMRSFTSSGAYASFEERTKGRIAPGYLADFVVLSQNPFDIAPAHLHTVRVEGVFIDGKQIL